MTTRGTRLYVRMQGGRQDFAWVGASTGTMSVLGASGGIFPREILKNQVVDVHFSCILRIILTLPLRLSGPLRRVRGSGQPFSLLLACRALARETKGSGDKRFLFLDSWTSCLHVCSHDVSFHCMGELWRIFLPLKIYLFQTASQNRALRFSCQGPAG